MNITIKTVPHSEQPYPTVGYWHIDEKGDLAIQVSDMGNPEHELLVALHELVEVVLCKKRGITNEQVDAFDKNFENERKDGKHGLEDEPGDDPDAPYREEHFFATNIERLMALEMDVDWKQYEDTLYSLP